MTETLYETPPTSPPSPPPPAVRLVRDPSDKVLAGVCAGLGRSTGTDPVLWRVTIAVLALFGGAGVLLYVLAWLLVPRAGAPESFVERVVRGGAVPTATAAVLGLLAVVTLLAVADDGDVPLALLVLGALAVLAVRERRSGGAPPPPLAGPLMAVQAVPRERSPLGLLTVSTALVLAGLLGLAAQAGADGLTAPVVLAVVLLVVGSGLLLGTWRGRARWLLLPGLPLALVAVVAAATPPAGDWSVGERTWVVTADSPREHRLGVGAAVLDLRGVRPGQPDVTAEVGVGELLVLVPDDVALRLSFDVGAGETLLQGRDGELTDPGSRLVLDGPGSPVDVDLTVGLGEIEVRRVAA